jgi:hypothetical protein
VTCRDGRSGESSWILGRRRGSPSQSSVVGVRELNQPGVTWLSYQSCELNSGGNWKETKDGVSRAVNQRRLLLYLVLSHTTVPVQYLKGLNDVGTHTCQCHLYMCTSTICSIPLFDSSSMPLVCLTNPFTYSYIVAMELFQRILVTF